MSTKKLSLCIPIGCTICVFIYTTLEVWIKIMLLFISFFVTLWNFPKIQRSLYNKPLYVEDIENTRFETYYINIMNVLLAIICAVLFENWILGKFVTNRSILELTALAGGNITFFGTVKDYVAKTLLSICHSCKLCEEAKSRRNSREFNTLNDDESISETSDLYNSEISLDPSNLALEAYNISNVKSNPII